MIEKISVQADKILFNGEIVATISTTISPSTQDAFIQMVCAKTSKEENEIGYDDGYKIGYSDGKAERKSDFDEYSYQEGYEAGYKAGKHEDEIGG